MEYVNNVGFHRRLGLHKPNVDKSIFKRRLATMREWELIELLPSKQYKLTETGLNNIKKSHQRLWKKMCARKENLLCLNCGYIFSSHNQDYPDCKIKDAKLRGDYFYDYDEDE